METDPRVDFAEVLKDHLTTWARDLEGFQTDGVHPWVLAQSAGALNYFGGHEWQALVADKLHRWGHALNSSQAFAVNLFAPARFSPDVARALWTSLPAGRAYPDAQRVQVYFEYSGPDSGFAKQALGEADIPTQIDVAVEGVFGNASRLQFVEVKLTESHFGSCRGARASKEGDKKRANPAPERCRNLTKILEDTPRQCWLAETKHRRYWDLIGAKSGLAIVADQRGGCPWQGGLYQVMRNWALARAILDRNLAVSIDLAICVHPDNHAAKQLEIQVGGSKDVIAAFNAMAAPITVAELDPRMLIKAQDAAGAPSGWLGYMERRYLLAGTPDLASCSSPSSKAQ